MCDPEEKFTLKELKSSPTKIVDADGETLDIGNLRLLAFEVAPQLPHLSHQAMEKLKLSLAQAGTFEKRTMPFHKKIKVLWAIFGQLFFGRTYRKDDRFLMALYKVYQPVEPPISKKWDTFKKHLKDYFIQPKVAIVIDYPPYGPVSN